MGHPLSARTPHNEARQASAFVHVTCAHENKGETCEAKWRQSEESPGITLRRQRQRDTPLLPSLRRDRGAHYRHGTFCNRRPQAQQRLTRQRSDNRRYPYRAFPEENAIGSVGLAGDLFSRIRLHSSWCRLHGLRFHRVSMGRPSQDHRPNENRRGVLRSRTPPREYHP